MRISVIVPVYNVSAYLGRCMRSLLAQTFQDREILLVDDGSTDGSGPLCDMWAREPGVRAIHRANGGLGMARNSGLEAARGEYALFLDPDDYFGPRLLENLADAAERCGADLAVGAFTMVGPDGRERPRALPAERVFRTPAELEELLLGTVGALPEEPLDSRYGLSACARLYRMEVIRRGGVRFVSERELISEDLIFNMDFLAWAASAVVTADASYFYCANAGSLSKRHREDRFAQDCALCRAVEERLARRCPEAVFRPYLDRLLISRARYDILQEAAYRDREDRSYPLRQRTAAILDAPALREALERYPWRRLPRMQGIFAWLMRERRVGALLALARLKRRFLDKRRQ